MGSSHAKNQIFSHRRYYGHTVRTSLVLSPIHPSLKIKGGIGRTGNKDSQESLETVGYGCVAKRYYALNNQQSQQGQ